MSSRRLCIMDLHTMAIMFFLVFGCDARKYSSVAEQFRTSASYSTNLNMRRMAAGNSRTLDEIMPNQDMPSDSSSSTYGSAVSSPSLPPYDSLAPIPLPENTPPFCIYPPFTPQTPPSIVTPLPATGGSGGGGSTTPSPPLFSYPFPSPPPIQIFPPPVVPSPPSYIPPVLAPPSPQMGPTPATPSYLFPRPPPPLSPIINVPTTPTAPGFVPGPTVFLPPIVYPPPAVPPPPYIAPPTSLWCVAKPSVPEPIIQEAMNYACGSGADCDQILPSGSCFLPDSLIAHASYAFNSYWQRTKVAGGTCEFGGTAMLVTVDPSYDGCHFIYY